MGYWGDRSYENDDAHDALDAGFERVHGDRYEQLMDDANQFTFEQVQAELAGPETLAAALDWLSDQFGDDPESWTSDDDEEARLAYAGVVVRHAELGVALPDDIRRRAIAWLEAESLDWESDRTRRELRRRNEIGLLTRMGNAAGL